MLFIYLEEYNAVFILWNLHNSNTELYIVIIASIQLMHIRLYMVHLVSKIFCTFSYMTLVYMISSTDK